MCQNGVHAHAKETEADIAEHVWKDNMNLKHWMYFFWITIEDLSFHSFLKASDRDF